VVDGVVIDARYVRNGRQTVFALHEDSLAWLKAGLGARALTEAAPKTEEWLGMCATATAMGKSPLRGAFREAWDGMEAAHRQGQAVVVGGVPVRMDYRRSSRSVDLCLHRDDVGILAAHLGTEVGLPLRTEDWLGPVELGPIFRSSRLTIVRDFARMTALPPEACPVPWKTLRTVKGPAAYIHRDRLPAFAAFIGMPVGGIPDKGEEWLSAGDLATTMRVSAKHPRLRAILALVAPRARCEPVSVRVEGLDLEVALRRTGPSTVPCIRRSTLPAVVALVRGGAVRPPTPQPTRGWDRVAVQVPEGEPGAAPPGP
jgi:hypothetical protein